MERRTLLVLVPAIVVGRTFELAAAPLTPSDIADLQRDWRTLLAPGADVADSRTPLKKSKAEWRALLDKEQYAVLREHETEIAGSSPLDREKRPGVFVCAGCSLPLFTSGMKFDSRTGWPSFFTSIPGQLGMRGDFEIPELPRTEYHCVRCEGHQGHLFNDGPKPTYERWCNNGIALRFIPF